MLEDERLLGHVSECLKSRIIGMFPSRGTGPGEVTEIPFFVSEVNADQGTDFSDFESFSGGLIGLAVSRIWQGYGSAIFVEFGKVQPGRRRDGSPGNARGEWTLMIKWSWRIEGKRRIWCGSWSDGERWPRAFSRLEGAKVTSAVLYGRLPEIAVGLSNGLHVVSMMTAEGDPAWALTKHSEGTPSSISVCAGRLKLEG